MCLSQKNKIKKKGAFFSHIIYNKKKMCMNKQGGKLMFFHLFVKNWGIRMCMWEGEENETNIRPGNCDYIIKT